MDLLQLKYFQTVARLEHITKAAEQLHIAQPYLSRVISSLEEELGVSLFNRKGRYIELNSLGERFLKRVDTIFHELEEGRRELTDMAGIDQGLVSIMATSLQFHPDIIISFLKEYPDCRFKLVNASTKEMVEKLQNKEVDFCISSPLIEEPEIECKYLLDEEIFLAVSAVHRFADREWVSFSELENEQFIALKKGYSMRDITDKLCRKNGFEPNIIFEVDEPSAMKYYVKANMGVIFTPESTLHLDQDEQLRIIRIKDPRPYRTIGLSWSKKRFLSKAALQFKQFVIDYFNKEKKPFNERLMNE